MLNAAEEIRNTIGIELPRLHAHALNSIPPTGQALRDRVAWISYVHEPADSIWKLQVDRYDGRLFEVVVQMEIAMPEALEPAVITVSFRLPQELRMAKSMKT